MAARNEAKATAAIAELYRETGKRAVFLKLDLADLRSVKAAAQEFVWLVFYPRSLRDLTDRATLAAKSRGSMCCSIAGESCSLP